MNIDIERLRRDMKDNFGTAMFNGFPFAVSELTKVERASDEELVSLAEKNNIDLRDYML